MPMVQLLQNRNTGEIVLVPFALHRDLGGGYVACGRLTRLSPEEFRRVGIRKVEEHLEQFYTRDHTEPSELYNEMPEVERQRFLARHRLVRVTLKKNSDEAKLWFGEDRDQFSALPFPFDDKTFVDDVLAAFDRRE